MFECEIVEEKDTYVIVEADSGHKCSPAQSLEKQTITVEATGSSPTLAALVDGKPVALNQGGSSTIEATVINGMVTVEDWHRTEKTQCGVVDNKVSINIESISKVACMSGNEPSSGDESTKDPEQAPEIPEDDEPADVGLPDPIISKPDTVSTNSDRVVIGYYESWAQWRRPLQDGYKSAMTPSDIDPTVLTHIYFAFMSFGFEIFDRDQNGNVVQKNPHNTGDYKIKPWEDNDITRLNELKALRGINPDLKIVVSLGGWNFNLPESAASSSPYIYSDKTNYLFTDMIKDVDVAHAQKSSAPEAAWRDRAADGETGQGAPKGVFLPRPWR